MQWGGVATTDAPDEALPPGGTGEAQDDATITENDTSTSSENISRGACLPFWRITCMLVCFDNGDRQHNDDNGQQGNRWHDGGDGQHADAAKRRRWATQRCVAMTATGGTTTARGSTATGSRTMATSGSTATARGSRVTGGTTTATGDTTAMRGEGRHDNGDRQHNNSNGQQGNRRHDDGDGRHDNCKTYCSCTPDKWNCKYCHGGHVVAELKCVLLCPDKLIRIRRKDASG